MSRSEYAIFCRETANAEKATVRTYTESATPSCLAFMALQIVPPLPLCAGGGVHFRLIITFLRGFQSPLSPLLCVPSWRKMTTGKRPATPPYCHVLQSLSLIRNATYSFRHKLFRTRTQPAFDFPYLLTSSVLRPLSSPAAPPSDCSPARSCGGPVSYAPSHS